MSLKEVKGKSPTARRVPAWRVAGAGAGAVAVAGGSGRKAEDWEKQAGAVTKSKLHQNKRASSQVALSSGRHTKAGDYFLYSTRPGRSTRTRAERKSKVAMGKPKDAYKYRCFMVWRGESGGGGKPSRIVFYNNG